MAILGGVPSPREVLVYAGMIIGMDIRANPRLRGFVLGEPDPRHAEALRVEASGLADACVVPLQDAAIYAASGGCMLYMLSTNSMSEVDGACLSGAVEDTAYDIYTVLEAYLSINPSKQGLGTIKKVFENLFRYTGLGTPSFRAPSGCETLLDRVLDIYPTMTITRKPGVWVMYTDAAASLEVCNSHDFGHLLAEALETVIKV